MSSTTPTSAIRCPDPSVTPDENGWVPLGTCGYLNRPYYPSFTAALVFVVAAAAVLVGFVLLTLRAARRRRHHLSEARRRNKVATETCLPRLGGADMVIAWLGCAIAACLLVAYVGRAMGTKNMQEPIFVAVPDTLVLLAPMLVFAFNGIILMTLASTRVSEDDKLGGLTRPALMRLLIIVIPLVSLEQFIAAVLIAPKHRPTAETGWEATNTGLLGVKLYLVGLAVQECLMLYTILPAAQLYRILRTGEGSSGRRRLLQTFNFSQTAILLRTTYRLVELSSFATGWLQFLARSEVYFYLLECLPVLVGLGVWTVVGVDRVLDGQASGKYLDQELDEETVPLASRQQVDEAA